MKSCKCEPLVSKPSNQDIMVYTSDLLNNSDALRDSFYSARDRMPWLDAIAYEDARQLSRTGKLNRNNIIKIFN